MCTLFSLLTDRRSGSLIVQVGGSTLAALAAAELMMSRRLASCHFLFYSIFSSLAASAGDAGAGLQVERARAPMAFGLVSAWIGEQHVGQG